MSAHNHSNRNDPAAVLAQLEAQGQLQGQAELQGQLQGQAELQAQGELQGQAQGEAQGQDQDQEQSQTATNSAVNELESHSGNGNLNGNANGNLNGNANLAENELESGVRSHVHNEVENSTTTDVTTTVDVSVSGEFGPPNAALNMDHFEVHELDGSMLVMPDFSTQTLNGDGNIFNLDQVNSLVDADRIDGASVSLSIGGSGETYDAIRHSDGGHGGPADPSSSFSFSQTADARGGTATNTSYNGDHGAVSGAANAANSLSQEAFTQHITMGANIQYNSMPITVVGGDSLSDLGAAAADHNG